VEFTTARGRVGNPPIQPLPTEDPELQLGPGEPTARFGGGMKVSLLGNPARGGGWERVVERGQGMRGESIQDDANPLRRGLPFRA